MEQQMIAELFRKYINNDCTIAEASLLMELLEDPKNEEIERELIRLQLGEETETQGNANPVLQEQLEKKLRDILGHINTHKLPRAKLFRLTLLHKIAAACIILMAGVFGYFLFFNQHGRIARPPGEIVKIEGHKKSLSNDVAPGGSRAILTLGNGRKIILDSTGNGTVASQGKTKIMKLANGQLAYKSLNETQADVVYNTLATPAGGQYQLLLPDGSKVWLDAASSITYPTAFVGAERKVEITGQAYFEVTKNENLPFIVQSGEISVQVLGTHFNVNAYSDESTVRTTLLEGSVRVLKGTSQTTIAPGEQIQVAKDGKFKVIKNADIDEAIAWKNGFFRFNRSDLHTVMRQLSRWYDVEVIYEGNIPPQKFGGMMERDLNLSEILEGLEKSLVHFRIEGKKLIVMP